jgi:hypothetical protein
VVGRSGCVEMGGVVRRLNPMRGSHLVWYLKARAGLGVQSGKNLLSWCS